MRYTLKNIIQFTGSPVGRMQLRESIFQSLWLLLAPLSAFYRVLFLRKTCIIAITGSMGKTTAMKILSALCTIPLGAAAHRNSFSFLALKLLRIKPGTVTSVIEIGIDRPGQMSRYARLVRPSCAVFLPLGSEHSRQFKTIESTRREKSEILRRLPLRGIAVLPGDDEHLGQLKSCTSARVITYGYNSGNDYYATDISLNWPAGMRFALNWKNEKHVFQTRLQGKHMIYPALAAVAAAHSRGQTFTEIIPMVENIPPYACRMQPVQLDIGAWLIRDEYKSPLETVHAALDTLAEIPVEKKIVVLGDISDTLGNLGLPYRDIGARLAALSAKVIVIGQNVKGYITGFTKAGGEPGKAINAGKNITDVLSVVKQELSSGTVILVKGRVTQRLERVSLGLLGKKIACTITHCSASPVRCDHCPMLERGWK